MFVLIWVEESINTFLELSLNENTVLTLDLGKVA